MFSNLPMLSQWNLLGFVISPQFLLSAGSITQWQTTGHCRSGSPPSPKAVSAYLIILIQRADILGILVVHFARPVRAELGAHRMITSDSSILSYLDSYFVCDTK